MKKKCIICEKEIDENEVSIRVHEDDKKDFSICSNCVERIYSMVQDAKEKAKEETVISVHPLDVYRHFEKKIISQDEAKKTLAVAVSNHFKRISHPELGIEKSNILLVGPTGCGKTAFAREIASYLQVPFVVADATSMTEAGYVGEDVSDILRRLLIVADGNIIEAQRGIIFIDEIDKLASSSNENTSMVKREGVQQALLKMLEGSRIAIPISSENSSTKKNVEIDTSQILFICGGAFPELYEKEERTNYSIGFHNLEVTEKKTSIFEKIKNLGFLPELLGRLSVIVTLEKLDVTDIRRILVEPENSIVDQYKKLLSIDGISLDFSNEAMDTIAKKAIRLGTGARGLRTIMEKTMLDIMFKASEKSGSELVVTKEMVDSAFYEPDKSVY